MELLVYTYMSVLTNGGLKGSGKLQLQRLEIRIYVNLMQFATSNSHKSHRKLGLGVGCDVKLFCSV